MSTTNPWKIDPKTVTLFLEDKNESPRDYYIPLEQLKTSAKVLDWIMQITSKVDISDRVIAWLVRDLNRILRPQATLCSGGKEKGPIDVKKLLKDKKLI
jgi:hypothetical protein